MPPAMTRKQTLRTHRPRKEAAPNFGRKIRTGKSQKARPVFKKYGILLLRNSKISKQIKGAIQNLSTKCVNPEKNLSEN